MATEQPASHFQSLVTMAIVVVESLFSLILRFDEKLRKAAYPLAKDNTIVIVRSYLPHEELYLTFSFKGVLIDNKMPKHKKHPDVVINAQSYEIFGAIISDKQVAIDKLQYRGDKEKIAQLKEFLLVLSFNGFVENLLGLFNKKQASKLDDRKQNKQADKDKVKKQVAQLKSDLDDMTISNAKYSTQIAEFESKKKTTNFSLSLLTLVVGIGIGRFFF